MCVYFCQLIFCRELISEKLSFFWVHMTDTRENIVLKEDTVRTKNIPSSLIKNKHHLEITVNNFNII